MASGHLGSGGPMLHGSLNLELVKPLASSPHSFSKPLGASVTPGSISASLGPAAAAPDLAKLARVEGAGHHVIDLRPPESPSKLACQPAPGTQPQRVPADVPSAAPDVSDTDGETEGLASEMHANDKQKQRTLQFCGVQVNVALLPYIFAGSTLLGGAMLLFVHVPLLIEVLQVPKLPLMACFGVIYAVTLAAHANAVLLNPGEVSEDVELGSGHGACDSCNSSSDEDHNLPRRAHRSWQYPRPVRRYDHFCQWLNQTIGLRNHRSFFIMLVGLLVISVLGLVADAALIFTSYSGRALLHWQLTVVLLHVIYSMGLWYFAFPVLRLQSRSIARNELDYERKHHKFCIVEESTKGELIPVAELSVDEHNELFDKAAFIYDASRNPFDKGAVWNCVVFWFHSRSANETGEF